MTPRLTDLFTEQQVEWFSFLLTIAIVPLAFAMYLHWQSLRRRFPAVTEVVAGGSTPGGVGKVKTS